MDLLKGRNAPRSRPMCAQTPDSNFYSYAMAHASMKSAIRFSLILLFCWLCSSAVFSQDKTTALSVTARWASTVAEQYWIQPNITYGVANNYALKLDVWQRKNAKAATPTLIYYHGGGWTFGDRTGATLLFLPYLQ